MRGKLFCTMRRPGPLVLLSCALLGALWLVLRGPPKERGPAPRALGPEAPSAAAPSDPHGAEGAPARPSEQRAALAPGPVAAAQPTEPAAPAALPLLPVERERASLRLVVLDSRAADAEPLAGVRIRARAAPGAVHDLLRFDDGRGGGRERSALTDAEGRASLADLPLGPWWIALEHGGHRLHQRLMHEGSHEHRIVLDQESPRSTLRIFVVEPGPAGGPEFVGLEGAHVELAGGLHSGAFPSAASGGANSDEGSAVVSARSGPGGLAVLEDPGYAGFVARARLEDGRAGSAIAWVHEGLAAARSEGLRVLVGRSATLRGKLLAKETLPPESLQGARVLARLLNNAHPHYTTHGAPPLVSEVREGHYAFDELPSGSYGLALEAPSDLRLALEPLRFGSDALPNSLQPLGVELAPGEERALDLLVQQGGAIEGVVRSPPEEGSRPLAGARVRATFAPTTSNFPDGFVLRGAHVWRLDSDLGPFSDHPATHWFATTDAQGRYRLGSLPAGRHRLEVALGGRRYERLEAQLVSAGETLRLEHVLEQAGAIAGRHRAGSYLGLARPGESALHMVAVLPRDGSFAFAGLAPGAWELCAAHSDASIAPVPLVRVEVEAGRTSWVDVDAQASWPAHLSGRVVDSSGPIAGALVRLSSSTRTTGAQGEFEFGTPFPHRSSVDLSVHVGALETRFHFSGMLPGETRWERELVLGEERLALATFDAQGRPAPAELELEGRPTGREELRFLGARTRTGASGELHLSGLAAGEYTLSATFADGSVARASLTLPTSAPLRIEAPPAGEIALLVRTHRGEPARARHVFASTWIGEGPPPAADELFLARSIEHHARTDASGRALLRGVRAGSVRVLLAAGWGPAGSGLPPPPRRIDLAPGERTELTLDELPP